MKNKERLIRLSDALRTVNDFYTFGHETIDIFSMLAIGDQLKALPVVNTYNTHEVAEILADLFGDSCACNFNGIDEWLPEKCELQAACPNPVGVACWEQYLKYRGEKDEE